MMSLIIPTLNAADGLAACVTSARALAAEVIVSDGGSADGTVKLAQELAARVIPGPAGRGGQLRRGAAAAQGDWLLFLHADTRLTPGAAALAREYRDESKAAVFRLAFDDRRWRARAVAAGANLRTRVLGLPYGDQGLLISRTLYDSVGGFADLPLMEDVDMARRLRGRLRLLDAAVITAADKYRRDGYARRVLRNWSLLLRYFSGATPAQLRDRYYS